MRVEWICARCAKNTGKTPEPDPVILRLCTECKVVNWVRPFGHVGEGVVPSAEEVKAAHELQIAQSKAWNVTAAKLEAEHKGKVEAAVDISREVEIDAVREEEAEEETEEAKEIAGLKARLAELEGE